MKFKFRFVLFLSDFKKERNFKVEHFDMSHKIHHSIQSFNSHKMSLTKIFKIIHSLLLFLYTIICN